MHLNGKVGIVTGSATGIGEATARKLAAEGARVIVADIDDEGGQAVVDGIRADGGDAVFTHLDVTSEAGWEKVAQWARNTYGGIDILVNNAGIVSAKPLAETSVSEWERVMAVNVTGPFLGMKHVIPLMTARGGASVVNMSSLAGLVGAGSCMAYTASKGAVRLMTKDAALEFAQDQVRVNSVHPGYVDTAMLDRLFAGWGESKEAVVAAAVPLGRMAKPEEVANLVAFLASDDSSFCTGSEFVIDGGETAR